MSIAARVVFHVVRVDGLVVGSGCRKLDFVIGLFVDERYVECVGLVWREQHGRIGRRRALVVVQIAAHVKRNGHVAVVANADYELVERHSRSIGRWVLLGRLVVVFHRLAHKLLARHLRPRQLVVHFEAAGILSYGHVEQVRVFGLVEAEPECGQSHAGIFLKVDRWRHDEAVLFARLQILVLIARNDEGRQFLVVRHPEADRLEIIDDLVANDHVKAISMLGTHCRLVIVCRLVICTLESKKHS